MSKKNKQDSGHRLTVGDVAEICNAPEFVDHYRAALERIGLWASEEILFEEFFSKNDRLLDLGCGAGRIAFGLWDRGYRKIEGIDISEKLIGTAQKHAEKTGRPIPFFVGDATDLKLADESFDGVIVGFGGLMQIPGRNRRRKALQEIRRILADGGILIFTTHDREMEEYREFWKKEAEEPLGAGLEFGDLHEEGPHGLIFVHVPDRKEVEE